MKISTTSFIAICALAASVSGCSQLNQKSSSDSETVVETISETQPTKTESVTTPVKQGADIVIQSTLAGSVAVGENGAATLSIAELYPEGTLTLTSTGSDGLNVFGAETTAKVDMSQDGPHTIRLDYSADTDGVFYINIISTASFSDGPEETRAHSVRVEIGNWEAAEAKAEKPQVEISESGEAMVILEAEETTE